MSRPTSTTRWVASPSLPRLPCTSRPPASRVLEPLLHRRWLDLDQPHPLLELSRDLRADRLSSVATLEPEVADLRLRARVQLAAVQDERGLVGALLGAHRLELPLEQPGHRLAGRLAAPQLLDLAACGPGEPHHRGQHHEQRAGGRREERAHARRPRQCGTPVEVGTAGTPTASRRSRQSPDMRLWQSEKSYFTGSSGSSARRPRGDLLGHPPVAAAAAREPHRARHVLDVRVHRHQQRGGRHVAPEAEVRRLSSHHPAQEEVQALARSAGGRPGNKWRIAVRQPVAREDRRRGPAPRKPSTNRSRAGPTCRVLRREAGGEERAEGAVARIKTRGRQAERGEVARPIEAVAEIRERAGLPRAVEAQDEATRATPPCAPSASRAARRRDSPGRRPGTRRGGPRSRGRRGPGTASDTGWRPRRPAPPSPSRDTAPRAAP